MPVGLAGLQIMIARVSGCNPGFKIRNGRQSKIVFDLGRNWHQHAVVGHRERQVVRIVRLGHDHFLAGIQDRSQDKVESLRGAGGNQNVVCDYIAASYRR